MTNKEAIIWLEGMLHEPTSEAELYCAEQYYGSGRMVYPEPEDYAIVEAIEVLKKQTPMKVKNKEGKHYCAKCKRIQEAVNYYCWNCGQKLDWKDEEYEDPKRVV